MSSISPYFLRSPHNSGSRELHDRNRKNSSSKSETLRKKTTKVDNKACGYIKPSVSFSDCSNLDEHVSSDEFKVELESKKRRSNQDDELHKKPKIERVRSLQTEEDRRHNNREENFVEKKPRSASFPVATSNNHMLDWNCGVPNANFTLHERGLSENQSDALPPLCKFYVNQNNSTFDGILEYLREVYKEEEDLSFLKTNYCEFLFLNVSVDEIIEFTDKKNITKDTILALLKMYMIRTICDYFEVEKSAISQLRENSFNYVEIKFRKFFSKLDSSL